MTEDEARAAYLTLNEAAALLGVTRQRMWQIAREQRLEQYEVPTDRRVKLFRRSDIVALTQPRPKDEAA